MRQRLLRLAPTAAVLTEIEASWFDEIAAAAEAGVTVPPGEISQRDLTVGATDGGDSTYVAFHYRDAPFERATIEALIRAYAEIVERAVADPDAVPADLAAAARAHAVAAIDA